MVGAKTTLIKHWIETSGDAEKLPSELKIGGDDGSIARIPTSILLLVEKLVNIYLSPKKRNKFVTNQLFPRVIPAQTGIHTPHPCNPSPIQIYSHYRGRLCGK